MIGENIKQLRKKCGMTQRELADKLYVTAQAVSRWENGEVEPSLSTISSMAKIFNVTSDQILGLNNPDVENTEEKNEQETYTNTDIGRGPVLEVCHCCNHPIYNPEEIYREGNRVLCKSCKEREMASRAKMEESNFARSKRKCWGRVITSFIVGAIMLALFIPAVVRDFIAQDTINASFVFSEFYSLICFFAFFSCLALRHNLVTKIISGSFTFGFRFMPGLIFELSLDGIIWLLTVKLFLWIINTLISVAIVIGAILLAFFASPFIYPFGLYKNIKHPDVCIEEEEDF